MKIIFVTCVKNQFIWNKTKKSQWKKNDKNGFILFYVLAKKTNSICFFEAQWCDSNLARIHRTLRYVIAAVQLTFDAIFIVSSQSIGRLAVAAPHCR